MRAWVCLLAAGLGWLLYTRVRRSTARVSGDGDGDFDALAPLSPFEAA